MEMHVRELDELLSSQSVVDDAFVDTSVENDISDLSTRIEYLLRLVSGRKVLHIGCCDHIELIEKKIASRTWLHGLFLEKAFECWGIDINAEGVEYVKSLGIKNVYCCDVTKTIPHSVLENQFDVVVLGEMVEHLDAPVDFLNALRRNLSGSYELVVTVPNAFFLENFINVLGRFERINSDHRAWYTTYTISKILSQAGYYVTDVRHVFRGEPSGYMGFDETAEELYRGHPEYRDVIVVRSAVIKKGLIGVSKIKSVDSESKLLAAREAYFKIKKKIQESVKSECAVIAADRDKAYAEKTEAWKAYDAVAAERDEVWKKVEAAYGEVEEAKQACAVIAADRDKAYAEKAEAWEAHDAVAAERDERERAIKLLKMELRLSRDLNDSLGAELDEIRSSLIWKMILPAFNFFHKR